MTATRLAPRELIERCQDLVRSIAVSVRRKVPRHIELEDLIAYGQIGLAEAAQDFDPKKGNAFSTYAYYRIRGAIYDGVSKLSWTSRSRYNRLRQDQRADEVVRSENGTLDESAQPTLPDGDTRRFDSRTGQLAMVYLANCANSASEVATRAFADPSAQMPSDLATLQEASQKVRSLVDLLPAREASLIRAVYFEGKTLQEAGKNLGISKSWASRIHAKTLKQLAQSLRLQGVSE